MAEPAPIAYLTLESPTVGQASHVHVTEIIRGLRRRGYDVRLVQPYYSSRKNKPGTGGRLVAYVLAQVKLWAGRRSGEIIYVRAHFMALPTALIARLFGIGIVHEINGPYEDIFVTYPWLKPFRRILECMQRQQYRWADHLLPVTQELADWLQRETGHKRITVIPNGANTELFSPNAVPTIDALPARYVIFFGGLARWHGVETMLAAIAHPNWPKGVDLVVVGRGQESERVRQAAAADPRIRYLGYQPYESVPGLAARSIGGLVPISDPGGRSQTGLLPLKLFETLACGVPAIVSDFPGQADLVRDHQCGLVVPAEDEAALARAVAELAADPGAAAAMGERGAALIKAEHSWDRRAGEVARCIDALRC